MGIVTTIAPVALALIMLGLGASLTVKDFTRVVQNPKEFFIGLICQLVLLPVIAYFLIIILIIWHSCDAIKLLLFLSAFK